MEEFGYSVAAVVGFVVVTERYQQWWERGETLQASDWRWAGINEQVDGLRLRYAPSTQHQWFLAVGRAALDQAENQGQVLTFERALTLVVGTVEAKCLVNAEAVARV